MAATACHPEPSAKAPWTMTMFLTGAAWAGATAAERSGSAKTAATSWFNTEEYFMGILFNLAVD